MDTTRPIRWNGQTYPVLEKCTIRRRVYLLLKKVSGREKYFAFCPHAGAGGDVFLVHRLRLDPVARQFLKVLARVSQGNRNMLKIVDFQAFDDVAYLVTTWVRGETLDERLKRARKQPRLWPSPVMAFHLYRKLAHGLHQLSHREKIVHGDIKPENLILDHNNLVIIDFGSAWTVENSVLQLNGDGQSELHASPEQHLRQFYASLAQHPPIPNIDFRSDMFSATTILYLLLTHELPFSRYAGKAALPDFRSTVEKTLYAPSEGNRHGDKLPRFFWQKLDNVVLKCLALDPDNRFGTTRAWTRELDEIDAALKISQPDGVLATAAYRILNWFFPASKSS